MSCEYRCYEVGGPWIDVDPNCPFHGYEAQRQQKFAEAQQQEIEDRIINLEEQVAWLIAQVKKGG